MPGNSAYHALQSRVERRFSRGLQLTASYTWSRFLDSTSEGGSGGGFIGNSILITTVRFSGGSAIEMDPRAMGFASALISFLINSERRKHTGPGIVPPDVCVADAE
jgi:hypothetical protein